LSIPWADARNAVKRASVLYIVSKELRTRMWSNQNANPAL
jgi:hypothetical protein